MTKQFDKIMKKAQKEYNKQQYVFKGAVKRNRGSIFPVEKKKVVRRMSNAAQWRMAAAMWDKFDKKYKIN